jgi:hypothetical protein
VSLNNSRSQITIDVNKLKYIILRVSLSLQRCLYIKLMWKSSSKNLRNLFGKQTKVRNIQLYGGQSSQISTNLFVFRTLQYLQKQLDLEKRA